MPKYLIDSKFGETIKTARIQNGIQAKALAEHLNKSPAYITKLERGEIKSIDSAMFDSIINYIFGDTIDKNSIVDTIYDSLKIKYSPEEIENILWFQNFSTITCKIPIPEELIDYINSILIKEKITPEYLLIRINSNDALSEEERKDTSIEDNQWFIDNSDNKRQTIRINMNQSYLSSILDKTRDRAPYIFIFCIIFYIKKILVYSDETNITSDQYKALYNDTVDTLNEFKFYSISEKNKILYNKQTTDDITEVLNSFDIENRKLLNDIISALQIYSELDVKQTNEYLSEFSKSLKWNIGFTLKITGLHYSELDKLTYESRNRFINEIEALIDKYSNTSEIKDKIEVY